MKANDFVIREATAADARALGSLSIELGYPNGLEQTSQRLQRVLGSTGHQVLVAEDDQSRVIGWVHVFGSVRIESDGFAELGGLVVTERWRGRGVGREMVTASLRWAVNNGYSTLRIRSRVERTTAHEFFQKLGFSARKTQIVFETKAPGNA